MKRILILYHSSVFDLHPGADSHIYYTSKSLSRKYNVTLVTWGKGKSKEVKEDNLTIIHFGNQKTNQSSKRARVKFSHFHEFVSYLGLNYLLFMKTTGPSIDEFSEVVKGRFDLVIRIPFNNSRIPGYLQTSYGVPIIELAIVSGIPNYLKNVGEWIKFINRPSVIGGRLSSKLHRILGMVISRLYKYSLSSHNVVTISFSDLKVFKSLGLTETKYIPPIIVYNPPNKSSLTRDTVLFFSGRSIVARIALEFIARAACMLKDIDFIITGVPPNDFATNEVLNNLTIAGYLPKEDFEKLLSECSLIIFPLVSGSGVQTKMIEALCNGKPIITTSVIAEQFPNLISGINLIIEDDPLNFVNKIGSTLKNDKLKEDLGKNAKEYYLRNLAPNYALRLLENYIENMWG